MIKIKICGITNLEDAEFAAKLGAWAIGFIFYQKSPRYLMPQKAKSISKEMKKYGVKTVGVFVNESVENINKISDFVELDFIQMHGIESATICESLNRPYIKNIRKATELSSYKNAFAFLADSLDTKSWGGTGKLADWEFAKEIKKFEKQLILSGGISIENAKKAINEVNPDYIDISSSIEISPGIKNHQLMKEFFEKLI